MEKRGNVRRATSAGYRLPDRPNISLISQSSVSVLRHSQSRTRNTDESPARDSDIRDPVKQDQVWREFVRAERAGVKEWEKNWGFLKSVDQLGRPRTETPLPGYMPLFSDVLPNTSNQTFGSRMRTELGKELMRMDRLLMLTASHRKTKQNVEIQPS
ncbi:ciliary microtubule inner protein 5 [Brachyhypopomus gauderio]|uniref:ciliary microtubule inner protein 5 n=1 Tax=Brachyhypopomus gauderio TaxID=698409 RepID=UPI004042DE7E